MSATRGSAWATGLPFVLALSSTGRTEGDGRALLVWERARGAESCISGDELARAVESHAGRPLLATNGGADVRVVGRVSKQPGNRGWRATLEIFRRDGGRGSNRVVAVEGRDCRGLDEALVLVLTIAVEPLVPAPGNPAPPPELEVGVAAAPGAPVPGGGGVSEVGGDGVIVRSDPFASAGNAEPAQLTNADVEQRPVAGETPPEREAPKPTEIARVLAVSSADAQVDRAHLPSPSPVRSGFDMAGSAMVSTGLMPSAAAGFGGSVAWVAPFRMSFELAGLYFPFGQSPTNVGRADYNALLGEVRACPKILAAPVLVDACASFQAGELRAQGNGFAVLDFSKSRPYVGWGAALRARIDVAHPVFVRFGLQATLPIIRDSFVVEAEDRAVELHRVARVVAVAGVDVGVAF